MPAVGVGLWPHFAFPGEAAGVVEGTRNAKSLRVTGGFLGPEPPCGGSGRRAEKTDQFSAVFLPSLYTYKVMAGFFSSPLGSKAMVVVMPLKLLLISSGV